MPKVALIKKNNKFCSRVTSIKNMVTNGDMSMEPFSQLKALQTFKFKISLKLNIKQKVKSKIPGFSKLALELETTSSLFTLTNKRIGCSNSSGLNSLPWEYYAESENPIMDTSKDK